MKDWGDGSSPIRPHNPVTAPKHYTSGRIEFTDAVERLGLGFAQGNVVKYVVRFPQKGGIEDLKKAQHYLQMMIDNYAAWYGDSKTGGPQTEGDQLETKP